MKQSLLTYLLSSLVRNIRQGISTFNTRIGQLLHGSLSALEQQNGITFSRLHLTRCALVAALLLVGVNSVWGETVTFTPSNFEGGQSGGGKAASATIDGISVVGSSAYIDGTAHVRIYKNATITISSENTITKIELTSTANTTSDNGPAKLSNSAYSYSGKVGTWIGSANSVTLNASAQFRFTQIVVTYAASTPAVDRTITWSINGREIEETFTDGTKPTPTLGDPTTADCDNEKVFVGWTTAAIPTATDTKPNPLYSTVELPAVTEDETYYAVFATEISGSATEALLTTVGFESSEGFTAKTTYNSSTPYTGGTDPSWSLTYGAFSTNGALKDSQSAQFRLYSACNKGILQTTSSLSNITKFTYYAKVSNTDAAIDLYYSTDNGTTWNAIETEKSLTKTSTQYTASISTTGEYSNVRIKIQAAGTCPSSNNYQIYIDDIAFYSMSGSGTTNSDYVTSCKTKAANTLTFEDKSIDLNTPFELFDAIADYNSGGDITYAFVGEHDGASISGTNGDYYFTGTKVGTYVIRATQEEDANTQAAIVDFTICVRLAAPTNLTQTVTTPTACLSWDGIDGATGYIVEMLSDDKSSVLASYETTNTYYDLSNLTLDGYYVWGVIATNGTVCCNSAQATSAFTAEAISVDGKWTIDWEPTSGATEWSRQAFTGDYSSGAGADKEYKISNFTLPADSCQYWVGYQGVHGNHWNGRSKTVDFSGNMTFVHNQDKGWQNLPYPGEGAIGTLRIYGNSTWDNWFVGFIPDGYVITYGGSGAWTINIPFTKISGNTWETAEVTIPSDYTSAYETYTGAKKADGTVVFSYGKSKTKSLSSIYEADKEGSMAAGVHGIFRMSDAAGTWEDNFSTVFIPYYNILYHDENGNFTESSVYISSEQTDRNITLPTPAARTGWTFVGWAHNPNPEGTDDIVEGGKTYGLWQPNDPLYQIWKENKYTITWSVNGDTYTSEVREGETPTLPEDANTTGTCDYQFIGWTETVITSSQADAPNDLFTTAPAASANKDYYAVFKYLRAEAVAGAWTLVTDASSLASGDKVIIAAAASDVAMNTKADGNNRGQATITKSENTLTAVANDVQIFTLEDGTKTGTWAFNTGAGYIYAASSSSNYLKTKADKDDNGSFTITIDNSIATITAQGTYTRNKIRHNSTSSLFSCYASGQQDVALYKQTVGTPEDADYVTSYTCVSYNLTMAVNGSGTTTPAVGTTTTVYENRTTTITATPAEGYTFAGWTVTGAGASIADTTALETELTVGTTDVSVTAHFIEGEWELVTDVNFLQAGDKVLIANTHYNVLAAQIANADFGVRLLPTTATFSADLQTATCIPTYATIFTLEGDLDAWKLKNDAGKYFAATSGDNKLDWVDEPTTWTMNIDTDGNLTAHNNERLLYYNGNANYNGKGYFIGSGDENLTNLQMSPKLYYKANTPRLLVSTQTLSGFESYKEAVLPVEEQASGKQTFTIEGRNLTADALITASEKYEISTVADGTYSNTLTILQADITGKTATVYVRLKQGQTEGTHTGSLTITSSTATRTIALTATVDAKRTVQSLALTNTPTQTEYPAGATALNKEAVTVTFTDDFTADVTAQAIYSADLTTVGEKKVTITYNHGSDENNSASCQYDIIVYDPNVTSTVTFYNGDDQYGDAQEVGYKQTVSKPADPATCGEYTFLGWTEAETLDANTQPTLFDFNTPIIVSKTLRAVYQSGEYIEETYVIDGTDTDKATISPALPVGVTLTYKGPKEQMSGGKSIVITSTGWNVTIDKILINTKTTGDMKDEGSATNFTLQVGTETTTYEYVGNSHTTQHDFTIFDGMEGVKNSGQGDIILTYSTSISSVWIYTTTLYIQSDNRTFTLTSPCAPSLEATEVAAITSSKSIVATSAQGTITALRTASEPTALSATVTGTDANLFSVTTSAFAQDGENHVATYHVSYTPTGTEQATHQATITFSATYDGKTLTYEVPITGYTVPESFAIVAHDGTNWVALPGNMVAAETYATETVDLDDTTNPTAVTRLPQVMVYNLLGVHADNAATSFGKVRIQNQSTTECLWASKSETSIKNDGQNASGATANYEWTLVTDNGTDYKLYNANHGGYLGINDGHWGMYAEGKAATVRFLPYNSICATIPAPSNLSVVATSLNEIVLTFLPIKNTEYYTIDHYEYRQANDTEWTPINELTANDNMLEFKVTGLEQDKAYTFYLRGCATEESQLCGERGENKITVSTTAPYVDIVAWGEKSITVNVDNAPDNMTVQVSQEVVVTSGSGIVADELFFSKYYEATGNLKLLGIYNGTDHDIDLTNYHIYMAKTHDDKGNETGQIFTEQNSTYIIEFSDLTSSLGGAPTTIKAGTEIILYNDAGDLADVISDDDPATTDESMGTCIAGNVPGATFENGQLVAENWYYHKNISWSGDRAIALYKDSEDGTSKEMIDIIGAWKDVDGKAVIDGSGIEAPSNYKSQGFEGDDPAWFAQGIQYNTDPSIQVPCVLSTNRCLLVRLNTVKSGMNAVTQNKGDFHTLATEWRGENVGGGSSGVQDLHVCQSFSIVSSFDYAKYYVIYQNLGEATTLTKNEDGTYTIPLANNTADLACKRMKLEFSSGTEVFTTKEVRIPIIISEPQTTAGKSFEALKTIHSTTDGTTTVEGDVAEICKTCDVVIQDNVVLTHTEGGNTTIQHLIVDAGAKLSVEKGQQFNVSSITLRSEGDKVPHLVLPDATSELASAQKMLTFTKRIKNDRYYFFSLPFNCNVSDIRLSNGGGVYNVDFLIKEYDGEMRATEGTGNDIKTWKIVDATAMLQAGKGYALAVSHSEDVEVLFPMMLTNTALHLVDNNAKGVAITAHGFDTQGNVTSAKAHNHLGWNFVGNPYFTSYGTLDDTDLKYGMINITNGITGDTWIEDGFLYINVPENGDQIYVQHRAQDKTINPFSAFFVQVATSGRLEYTPTTRVIPQSLAPRRAPAATAQPVYVGISLSNGVQSDETSLVISDHFTQDYEVGSDLEKMLGLGTKPQLYIKDNNYKYAFKALNEHDAANANMLGVYLPAKAETEYTIALMENYDLSQVQAVYLHDNVEGITINLMQTPYTFIHGYAHNTTRFALSAVLAPRMTTDLSNVPTTWAVWQDAPLHVRLEGLTTGDRICVIDATGQLVYETITTTSSGEISLPTAGAYCIETIGQAGLQVKKVIVK